MSWNIDKRFKGRYTAACQGNIPVRGTNKENEVKKVDVKEQAKAPGKGKKKGGKKTGGKKGGKC
jgi:hypothetical protein